MFAFKSARTCTIDSKNIAEKIIVFILQEGFGNFSVLCEPTLWMCVVLLQFEIEMGL